MGLVGEAGALRDIGENGVVGVEHATRSVEPQMQKVLVWRRAHRLLEGAREVRCRKPYFGGEKLNRQVLVQIGIHQLQRAAFGGRRQPAAMSD